MNEVVDLIRGKLDFAHGSYEIIEHEPVYTMEDVKRTIEVPFASRVKTMVVALHAESAVNPVLCGLRADGRLALKQVAKILGVPHSRVTLMAPEVTELTLQMPREAIGLVTPYGSPQVLLSTQLSSQSILYFGVGRNDRTLKIAVVDLQRVTNMILADIEKS